MDAKLISQTFIITNENYHTDDLYVERLQTPPRYFLRRRGELTVLHCLSAPAILIMGQYALWCRNGLLHRENGPAELNKWGQINWFRDGLLHRLDGPACDYGNTPREGWDQADPAIWFESMHGQKQWWVNGQQHRLEAPAEIFGSGPEVLERWWVRDNNITTQVNEWIAENDFPPWQEWTPEIKALWRLWFLN